MDPVRQTVCANVYLRPNSSNGAVGVLPRRMSSGSCGFPFSQTRSMDRSGAHRLCEMSAGIAVQSPGFMSRYASKMPVSRSRTSIEICPFNKRNHSTRSLPWVIGRMYSSVVGQNRLYSTAETISGFHVTSFRARYSYRLSSTNRSAYSGLIFISPSFPRRSWKDRKSTRLNSSHTVISYAVFCLKKKKKINYHRNEKYLENLIIYK